MSEFVGREAPLVPADTDDTSEVESVVRDRNGDVAAHGGPCGDCDGEVLILSYSAAKQSMGEGSKKQCGRTRLRGGLHPSVSFKSVYACMGVCVWRGLVPRGWRAPHLKRTAKMALSLRFLSL